MRNNLANLIIGIIIAVAAISIVVPVYSGPIVMEPSYSAGTAALPSLHGTGDPDTGIWFPEANTVSITTGGTEAIRWNSSQQTLLPDGTAAAPSLAFASETNLGFRRNASADLRLVIAGADEYRIIAAGIINQGGNYYGWGNGATSVTSPDLFLLRDAANILAQRNGTNAQEFRIWNSDGAVIDEFLSIGFINNSNVVTFETEQVGGGTVRNFAFMGGNVGIGYTGAFGTDGTRVLGISADGVVPSTSPAGLVQIFADDSSDGAANATLAIRTEQAVEAIGTFTESHKLKIWVNGVEYWVSLDAV